MGEPRAPESTPPEPSDPAEEARSQRMVTVLSGIAAQARQTNARRIEEIREALHRAESGDLDHDGWAAAERAAHQLAGSAGTFGFEQVSQAARALERLLARSLTAGRLDDGVLARAQALLDRAGSELSRGPDQD